MSDERLDKVLRELNAHPIQMSSFYENHYDDIKELESRCLVSVDWDDIRIKNVKVSDIGREFLLRGGFKEDSARRARTQRTTELAEARESRERRSEKRSTWSLYLSVLNLGLLALADRKDVGVFLTWIGDFAKLCWRVITNLV